MTLKYRQRIKVKSGLLCDNKAFEFGKMGAFSWNPTPSLIRSQAGVLRYCSGKESPGEERNLAKQLSPRISSLP